MKKLQSEISATLDESRARGPTASATQQTTPSLFAPRQEGTSIKRTHTGAGNPGRVAPRNPPWQQVRPKNQKPNVTAASNGESDTVLTSEAEVLAALRKTKIEKAPGPDCIPNAALHTLVAN